MTALFTQPLFGGDWSPEQWDQRTIDSDIALMQEAGVTMISLGIFSWAHLEPQPGQYDLDWLGRIIDQLADAGIAVDLATGTASPPVWMARSFPDSLPMDSRGLRLGFGSRQQYCPTSPRYRQSAVALTEALAKRFGTHPNVVLWHINNEYGCHVNECFCSRCAQHFRTWLQERYENIDTLNSAWGTAFWAQRYNDFGQVEPPALMPTFHNPGHALDWRRFSNDMILTLCTAERDVIRQYSDRPVTTNFMGSFPKLNYAQWAKEMDVISDDHYPDPASDLAAHDIAWQADVMRGLATGKPWFLMEQTTGTVQWRDRNSMKRPGQFLLWSLERIARGAQGVLQFQWRQSVAGSETFHSGMVNHAGKSSRIWNEVTATGNTLKKLSPVLGEKVHAKVAIVIDWESMWARQTAIGPVQSEPFARVKAWHRTLWEMGIVADVIPVDVPLEQYDLVIVAELFIDYPDFARSLRDAVARGAHVIVEGPTGVVNSQHHAVMGGYLGALKDLTGVAVVDQVPLTGNHGEYASAGHDHLSSRISRAVGTPAAQTYCGLEANSDALKRVLDRMGTPAPDLRSDMWAELIVPSQSVADAERGVLTSNPWLATDVEIIASYDGRGGGTDWAGMPAVTKRQQDGAGAAWYCAVDLDTPSRHALATLVCAHARIRPAVTGLPDGVEVIERGSITFYLNHGDRAVELSGVVGVDLLTGAACSGHIMLPPRSAIVLDPRPTGHNAGKKVDQ